MAFIVCHLAGDFLLQTDHQALHKHMGLSRDPVKRRALFAHVTTYTLAYVPALIWIGDVRDPGTAAIAAVAIFIPHLIQDDARLIDLWTVKVKRNERPTGFLAVAIDQSFHIIALCALALALSI